MSAIGRIFLILNLILSAVFLGFASSQLSQQANVTQSLRNEQAAHEASKKSLGDQISALNTQVNQLKTDTSALRDDRDQQKLLAERNFGDLTTEKNANAQLRGELTGIKESLAGYNNTIKDLTASKDRLTKEREDALAAKDSAETAKEAADKARRDAEETLQKARSDIAALEMKVTETNKKASALDTELKALYVATGYPRIGTPLPLVEGAVVSVNNSIKPGLLAINKGSNDKVAKGFVFAVYNGGVYKGQAKVETVQPDYCSALMILTAEGAPAVAQGDRVTTQL
jgi:cell division protein FtsB